MACDGIGCARSWNETGRTVFDNVLLSQGVFGPCHGEGVGCSTGEFKTFCHGASTQSNADVVNGCRRLCAARGIVEPVEEQIIIAGDRYVKVGLKGLP